MRLSWALFGVGVAVLAGCSVGPDARTDAALLDEVTVSPPGYEPLEDGEVKDDAFSEWYGPAQDVGLGMLDLPPGFAPLPEEGYGAFDQPDAAVVGMWSGSWDRQSCLLVLSEVDVNRRAFSLDGGDFPSDVVAGARAGDLSVVQLTASCARDS